MLAGQVFESLQTVVDEDNPLLIPRGGRSLPSGRLGGGLIHDGVGTTFLQRLESELVAIKRLTLQGKKDAALRAVARVGSDAGMLLIELIKFLYFHNLREFWRKNTK